MCCYPDNAVCEGTGCPITVDPHAASHTAQLLQRLRREMKAKIDEAVEERILTALLGDVAADTRNSFRALYRCGAEGRSVAAH